MKNTKRMFGLFFLITILVSFTLFAGCSTFPTASLVKTVEVTYEIIGYVGPSFWSYNEAFKAAKAAYPEADAVIRIKGWLDDKIPATGYFGFFAVKFIPIEIVKEKPKKLEKIF